MVSLACPFDLMLIRKTPGAVDRHFPVATRIYTGQGSPITTGESVRCRTYGKPGSTPAGEVRNSGETAGRSWSACADGKPRQERLLSERDAQVQAENGEPVVIAVTGNIDCVQLPESEVESDDRQRRDEKPAAVVGRTVHADQGAAKSPILAELELVAHSREFGDVAAGVPVKTGLDERYAACILVKYVVEPEPQVDLVIQ